MILNAIFVILGFLVELKSKWKMKIKQIIWMMLLFQIFLSVDILLLLSSMENETTFGVKFFKITKC